MTRPNPFSSTATAPASPRAHLHELMGEVIDIEAQLTAARQRYRADTQGPAFEETRHERRAQWLKQFEGAFLAIGNMKRLERPSTKLYTSAHIQLAERLLRSFGRPGMTIRSNVFLAAVLAHYEVAISGIGRHHEGIVPEIGLDEFSGRPATDQWRRILEGQAPREVAVSRPPAPLSPARVIVNY